jgi:hypothetical protein
MKKHFLYFTLFVLNFYSNVYAQQTLQIKRLTVNDIFIQSGFFTQNNTNFNISDFKLLSPSSEFLKSDLSGYTETDNDANIQKSFFSVLLGFKFSDKEKKSYRANPLLRLGISYISGTRQEINLTKEESKPFDTLASNQTANTVILDSITSTDYRLRYDCEQLFFDASVIFRTNPDARWSLCGGAGFAIGISIDARTEIRKSIVNSEQVRFSNGNGSYEYSYSEDVKSEKYSNDNGFGFIVYVPIGVDFRIGKQNEFWKQVHLFYEIKPGINMMSVPELKTFSAGSMEQGMGVRINW